MLLLSLLVILTVLIILTVLVAGSVYLFTTFGRQAPSPKLCLIAGFTGATFHGVSKMILKTGFKCKLIAQALKADGSPARVDGAIQWEQTEGSSVIRFEPAYLTDDEAQGQDPNAIWVVANEPGVTQVTGIADADLGEGVEEITGYLDITVPNIEAATFSIQAGEPVPAV